MEWANEVHKQIVAAYRNKLKYVEAEVFDVAYFDDCLNYLRILGINPVPKPNCNNKIIIYFFLFFFDMTAALN